MDSLKRPVHLDIAVLALFTIFITFHPYYLHGRINLFELGIYLPGINALLDGNIPYRDFFHLRGPLELYVPALFMKFFGENVSVLATYFYVGTVATLIVAVFLAAELYRSRLVLYLMIPVLIGRTFPRVVFTNWGGMRYGLGLLAILWAVYFFRHRKMFWIFLSGLVSALAFLTSIEVGVCSIGAVFVGIVFNRYWGAYKQSSVFRDVGFFVLGLTVVLLPYGTYLFATGSLVPYFHVTYAVATKMTAVFSDHFLGDHPQNVVAALSGMNPWSPYFKHLTPAYCYLFFIFYIIYQNRNKEIDYKDIGCVCLSAYGLIMYVTAFRKIGAAQFEMALQPEKILLFYMLGKVFFFLLAKRRSYLSLQPSSLLAKQKIFNSIKIHGIHFLLFAFVMSSAGYSLARYNHRFFMFQYVRNVFFSGDKDSLTPLAGKDSEKMLLPRLKGLVVPAWQATDFKQLTQFVDENTEPGEKVFMFPELGAYSFIVDRPFVGRFPTATFSWIGNWHSELFQDLKEAKPRYVVLAKDPGETFPKAYFKVPRNKDNYDEMMNYITKRYERVSSTESLFIYQRK